MTNELLDYGSGIHAFDAGYQRPQLVAVHLLVHEGRAAFIDTGTNATLPRALAALAARGLEAEAVDYVILTHIHLDHAGGAGAMMAAFPRARLVVHPRGARHMVEPSKLMASVEAVYGKERARDLYGVLKPVAAERIIEAPEGTTISLAGRALVCLDTPGHARHHIVIHDEQSRGVFTGDTLGIAYRELYADGRPFLFPTTTPSQFDPEALAASIERIRALVPRAAYLTHFGQLLDPCALIPALLRRLDAFVDIATTAAQKLGADEATALQGGRARNALLAVADGDTATDALHSAIVPPLKAYLLAEARTHGVHLADAALCEALAMDIELNAQGLALWAASHGAFRPVIPDGA
ncbi:MAG: MBL fold metallo-hydrolase [Betaproteobacteria bacterium HGW-Betaproteobacteria-11]|nr:MAG: MBL fold metallo-hydrolase [Betaproteobacteria bacterium HGW-Betaproteobacteria-11]